MCLDSLEAKVKTKYGKQRAGYKVFTLDETGGLNPTDQGRVQAKPRGEWLKEADYRLVPDKLSWRHHYRLGFHICLTVEGAKDWARMVAGNGHACKVVHVMFKYPTAWGYQQGSTNRRYPLAVARQIKIGDDV